MVYTYEKGLIRPDRGLVLDKGNQFVNPQHPDCAGGAQGDGVADDRLALAAADVIAQEIGAHLMLGPDTVFRVGSDLTITSGIVSMGGLIRPADGVTVTIAGGVWSLGEDIIDTSAGGIDGSAFPGLVVRSNGAHGNLIDAGGGVFNAMWSGFGAVGDGEADDTAALQGAITYITARGGGDLYLPPGRTFRVTAPLVLPRSIAVGIHGDGRFSIIRNEGTGPAIKWTDDATNVISFCQLRGFRIDLASGASGVLVNNSVASTTLTGTVSVTNGLKQVIGTGTSFLTQFDESRDTVTIAGGEYDIRRVVSNTLLEITTNFPGSTAGGLPITRNRYGNGGRWCRIERLWIQGEGGTGNYGIRAERINNFSFEHIIIRSVENAFQSLSLNGRSAGNTMRLVIGSGSTTVGFDFTDCRSWLMDRVRNEGNVPIGMRFTGCHAMKLNFCTTEDDHTTAGMLFDTCERIMGEGVAVGTNFGGGVGIKLVNTDMSTFMMGQVAYQAFRAGDYPITPDVIKHGIEVDAASQACEFRRIALENGVAAIGNSSNTTTIEPLDWDTGTAMLFYEAIPRLAKIKTATGGGAITTATALSKYDAGTVRFNADGGAFSNTLPNATAENVGLEYELVVEGSTDNAVTFTRTGTDIIEYVTSTSGTSFSLRRGNVVKVKIMAVGVWQFVTRFSNRVAGVGAGVASPRMANGNAATSAGMLEHSPGKWVHYYSTHSP